MHHPLLPILAVLSIIAAIALAWRMRNWRRVEDEACWSGWEDDDPYLAEQVRAALHPLNVEEMPFGATPKPLTSNESGR